MGSVPTTGERRSTVRLVIVVTAVATLTRLPGLLSARMYNVDEGYLAAMGWVMGHGGHLYIDVVDRKPPVLPWIYSLSVTLFGNVDLRFVRALSVIAVAGTALVVALLVHRLGQSRSASTAAGLLVGLGTMAFPPADGLAANFELFALLPASSAVLAAVQARSRARWSRSMSFATAGTLVGIAAMTKQPLAVVILPVGWEAWRGSRRFLDSLSVLIGLAGAFLAIGVPFGVAHVVRWAWLDTYDFLNGQVGGWRAPLVLAVATAAFAVLHLPVFAAAWNTRRHLAAIDAVAWTWLGAATFAIVPGFRFILHYYLILVPPLALVVGLVWDRVAERLQRIALGASAAIALGCGLVAFLPVANASQVSPSLVANVDASTTPADRVMVWGALPELYWRVQRMPSMRFLSVGYVNGNWADQPHPPPNTESAEPYRSRWAMFYRDLRAHPPTAVVDMSGSTLNGWSSYPADNYSFGRLLHECYQPVTTIQHDLLWRLTSTACVEEHLG